MAIDDLKISVIRKLLSIDDMAILQRIERYFDSMTTIDHWDTLSMDEQNRILAVLDRIDEADGWTSHDEIHDKYNKLLGLDKANVQ